MGRTFFTCTNENTEDSRFWCATTGSYDLSKKWSYCADTRLDDRPTGPCAFPFIYQGESYSTCKTDKKGGKLWCSLTSNYDEDRQWRYCDPSEHRPCTFPFIFENNAYFACTREGAGDNALWCATTDDYDRDTKWKVCALEEYGGSSNGKPCIFPFIYRNETYYNCTTENSENGLFWCATTANYNQDKEWSYCPDENYNLPPLHLPSLSGESAPWSEKPCLCIQTLSWMVPPRQISKVTIYPEGPQCSVPEVIATLKSGREICLDPTAAWVRKVMAMRKKNLYQTHQ
ncbi:epididymal sperm-binding protein 1-like [Varanus komodoensis]|uniref:epididymal sperm-binding protein 1-like n=1 Tax=Varanus komodoensis TaxID=61221 RepID=UPI001CF76971|nr:epididymal sperm-binding protein 1-like [Varanus komodoensis]